MPPFHFENPEQAMRRALELAGRGEGAVEPNPAVGAVIVDEKGNLVGEGYHEQFGGPHAEVNAIAAAGANTTGRTLFVTLEPCSHHGKTPPCAEAVIRAGFKKVFVATPDPSPHTAGKGFEQLRAAGVEVEVGLLEDEAKQLIAPFLKLLQTGRPYVHAKWAMTLDGKIAARTGHSQWISNSASREITHQIRGRMDAIVVGAGTAAADNPTLTARPPGPRTSTRIVIDTHARLPLDSNLVRTISEAPVLLAVGADAEETRIEQLQAAGVEVLQFVTEGATGVPLHNLLDELGRRGMTNILVEGGGRLLGSFFDGNLVDEAHVFIAPKIVGGAEASSPVGGVGLEEIPEPPSLEEPTITVVEGDIYIRGAIRKS